MGWHENEKKADAVIEEERNDPIEIRKNFRESVKKGEKFIAPKSKSEKKGAPKRMSDKGEDESETKNVYVTGEPKMIKKAGLKHGINKMRGRSKGSKGKKASGGLKKR